MVPAELVVLLAGRRAGVVRRRSGDRLSFVYDEGWRYADGAFPLSLSMPLLEREHGDAPVRAYLEGLLPERRQVLESWGRRFRVSSSNAYGLLAHVEECPGAVQLLPTERVPDGGGAADSIEWLADDVVAERLRDVVELYRTGAAVKGAAGYFSLPGAQPKLVLRREGRRWAAASSTFPSTHILKPPALDLRHFALNEHFCLLLAHELGLAVPLSEVHDFAGQAAFVVERFDRVREGGEVTRIHQEDFCQALAVRPSSKYEAEGGPGAVACAQLVLEHVNDPDTDVACFIDALALNWVMLGTDAHAKNLAFLYRGSRSSLAPLYDLVSVLPYPEVMHAGKARLAMRIGNEYRAAHVRRRHWEVLARALEVDADTVADRVTALLEDVPAALERARSRIRGPDTHAQFADMMVRLINAEVPKRLRAMTPPA